MKVNRDTLLKYYRDGSPKQLTQRQLMFSQQQMAGLIPSTIPYSDEHYADYIGLEFASLPSPAIANEYLVNLFNRLAWIEFKTIAGKRAELFNRGLTEPVTAGDTYELQYVNTGDIISYDPLSFVPTKLEGGDKVLAQQYRLCSLKTNNPDKCKLSTHVPILTIQQALLPAITSGLASGWPEYFNEYMERTWEKWKFERFRTLVSFAGGTPVNTNEWTDPATTFTANINQFVELDKSVTTQETFQEMLLKIYAFSAKLEGNYSNEYNPAGIYQINPISTQSLFLDSSLQTYWRTTNAIVYNNDFINPNIIYKKIDFFEMKGSKIPTTPIADGKIKAILYVDYPFRHTPFTQGIRRGTQMWENNAVMGIYDNFWLTSAIDLSKPIIIFYEKA